MTALLLAALSLPLFGDVVHTRDGKKIEGKVIEYEFFVDVEQDPPPAVPAGKTAPPPTRILRRNVLKIDYTPDFIHFPELIPWPQEQLEKANYLFMPCGPSILCLPKHDDPHVRVFAVDLREGKVAWHLDLPNRIGETVVAGRTVYFMQREKTDDPKKKVKINGVAAPKEIHRLTVTAVEIATGAEQWKAVFDNSEAVKQHWEFIPIFPPVLYVLPDRISIRTMKLSYPMDGAGNVNKDQPTRMVNFSSFDPAAKKIIASIDSKLEAESMGIAYFSEDQVISQVYEGGARFRLSGISLRDGKPKWQSEQYSQGMLFDVTEEFAYVSDSRELFTYSVKNGTKTQKWSIDVLGGKVAGIDLNYIYLYRDSKDPKAIVGFDPKKGNEVWKIDFPEKGALKHLLFAGHRLLYTDQFNTIYCFDTLAKKEMWRWSGIRNGFVDFPRVMGSTLSFFKDGLIIQLDLETGRKIWEVKSEHQSVMQAGDAGVKCNHIKRTDILRERKLPKGAEFFLSTGTPLKYHIGVPLTFIDEWSIPAIGKDAIYSISTTGLLAAVDTKEQKLLWTQRISNLAIKPLSPPIVHSKGIAVNTGAETVSYDFDGKTKQWSAKHFVLRPDRQCEVTSEGLLTVGPRGAALLDPSTGKPIWETPLKNITGHSVSQGKIYAWSSREMTELDLKKGAAGDPTTVPTGISLLATEGKKMFAAIGPYALYDLTSDEPKLALRPKQQDMQISAKGFKGSLVMADGAAFYTHTDGQVVRYEPGADKPTWTFDTPAFTSPLLVHAGRLWFAAGGQGLFALNLKSGAVEWKLDGLPDAKLFTPFLRGGKVAFWSSDGWIVNPD